MTISNIATYAIVLVLIGYIVWRQLRWTPLIESKLWRMPIILVVVGLISLSGVAKTTAVTSEEIAIIAVELVFSIAIGAVMGAMARMRLLTDEARAAYGDKATDARFDTSTSWVGALLWVALILVRVGTDVWATHAGLALVASTGVVLLAIAANRAARAAVFASRLVRVGTLAA